MKDTKATQLLGLIVAAMFTCFMIYFIKDSGSASAIAVTFTAIVGTFIGLDIALMIKKTAAMPEGGYKEINTHRYIAGMVIFAVLLIETFVISGVYQRNCDTLFVSFGIGLLVILGGFINGMESNKIATKDHETPEGAAKE